MRLERITWAVDDVSAMVNFLNVVFDAGLMPVDDTPFHRGSFLGMPLLLCPNDIAEVDARQNRHQFRIAVADLDATIGALADVGGRVLHDDASSGARLVGIADPDGNTYELTAT